MREALTLGVSTQEVAASKPRKSPSYAGWGSQLCYLWALTMLALGSSSAGFSAALSSVQINEINILLIFCYSPLS